MTNRARPLLGLLRRGWLLALADFGLLAPSHLRVAFLGAASRAGVLKLLAGRGLTVEELGSRLGNAPGTDEGLRSWLDLGVALGELRLDGERYRLRGRRAKSLARPANDPVAAFYEEYAELDHRLVVEAPARLKSGTPFVLSDADPAIVARASRMAEPWLQSAITDVIPPTGDVRLLEVGCGTGAHIRTACSLNPRLTAVGVELQEAAADEARRQLEGWGLGCRVSVEIGDIRDLPTDPSFDVATLHQNIYYVPDDEKADFLRHVASFLRPGGTLLVTTVVRGNGFGAAALDLWGALTEGASRMPIAEELEASMRQAGLVDVSSRSLGPDGMYRAFVGRVAGVPA